MFIDSFINLDLFLLKNIKPFKTISGSGRDELHDDTRRVLESIQEEMPKSGLSTEKTSYCLGLPSVMKQLRES